MSNILLCVHCGEPVGEVTDSWGGKHGWIHHPDEGDSAYSFCKCQCAAYIPDNPLCCDGEEAEPSQSLIDGLVETVAQAESPSLVRSILPESEVL